MYSRLARRSVAGARANANVVRVASSLARAAFHRRELASTAQNTDAAQPQWAPSLTDQFSGADGHRGTVLVMTAPAPQRFPLSNDTEIIDMPWSKQLTV